MQNWFRPPGNEDIIICLQTSQEISTTSHLHNLTQTLAFAKLLNPANRYLISFCAPDGSINQIKKKLVRPTTIPIHISKTSMLQPLKTYAFRLLPHFVIPQIEMRIKGIKIEGRSIRFQLLGLLSTYTLQFSKPFRATSSLKIYPTICTTISNVAPEEGCYCNQLLWMKLAIPPCSDLMKVLQKIILDISTHVNVLLLSNIDLNTH